MVQCVHAGRQVGVAIRLYLQLLASQGCLKVNIVFQSGKQNKEGKKEESYIFWYYKILKAKTLGFIISKAQLKLYQTITTNL